MWVAGIDPGKKGYMALIDDKDEVHLHPLPYVDNELDPNLFLAMIAPADHVFIERPIGKINSGVWTRFSDFGGMKTLAKISKKVVTLMPKVWKSHYKLDSDKQKSIDKAKELYPKVNLFRSKRCRKEDDNMAEAILIAKYGKDICLTKE